MLACSTWGGGGAFGAEGSLAAVGSIKSGCSSCCADAAERGVLGSRWGVSLFCARFALSKLRLLLFEARLSGYCVREGEVKGINPGFLVLGFSTRALKSRGGVPARRVQAGGFCVGMLSLVCSTPACPGLMVVVRFSCGPPWLLFGVMPLVVKLPALCWLAALRGVGGAFGAGSWLL